MKIELHPSSQRGTSNIDWLDTKYSFSFANYFNIDRMGFGALRVLNDDTIAPGGGFDTHPHDNMEIITIVLSGELHHQDSMGNSGQIKSGEVQVMSAGSGVEHSEYNGSDQNPLELFQIWIESKERDIAPRYDQKSFQDKLAPNQIIPLVSGDQSADTLYIHQDAQISMASCDKDTELKYQLAKNHGLFVMAIEGEISIDSNQLKDRDAIAISEAEEVAINARANSKLLLIEIPL